MGKRGPQARVWTVSDIEALATTRRGCLEWNGIRNAYGYGLINRNGTTEGAHRAIWEVATGEPIPPKMKICHRCDNPACIKLAHLFMGTQADNILDMMKKGRHWNAKLNAASVRRIRDALAAGKTYRAIADRFNVSVATVGMIKSRLHWTHVKQ